MLWLLLLLLLQMPVVFNADAMRCPMKYPSPIPVTQYQPGGLIIGGITSKIFHIFSEAFFKECPSQNLFDFSYMVTKFYQHLFALAFAVKEINEDPKILPNITLGFHIYDSYHDARATYRATLDLLFKSHNFVPNYKCGTQKNLLAIIGGLSSDTSFHIRDNIDLYKIPQLTYGSFPTEDENNESRLFSFYRMVPNEAAQYMGIISLLKHFGWTWVGLFVVDDEGGQNFLQIMEPLLSENGICSAFTRRLPKLPRIDNLGEINEVLINSNLEVTDNKANTFIIYGESMALIWLAFIFYLQDPEKNGISSVAKVWIITTQIDFILLGFQRDCDLGLFQGAICFTIHSKELLGFHEFLLSIKPDWIKGNGFLRDFWEQAFDCTFPNPSVPKDTREQCTGEERLGSLPDPFFEMSMTGHSYSIYNAVHVVGRALHDISLTGSKHRAMFGHKIFDLQDLQPWQVVC